MDKNFRNKRNWWYIAINAIMLLYTLSACKNKIAEIIERMELRSCEMTDHLINYQGGFVRRGLTGEILFQIRQYIDFSPEIPIISLCLISLAILTWYLICGFIRNNLCWWILPLNICMTGAFILRKDYPCMLLVLVILLLYKKLSPGLRKAFCIGIFFCISICIHECVFFILYPFLVLITLTDKNSNKLIKLATLLPGLVLFALLFVCKGDSQTALRIHQSWNLPEMGPTPAGTIKSLGDQTSDFINFHLSVNFFTKSGGIYGIYTKPIIWLLTLFIVPNILFIKNKATASQNKLNLAAILTFQFCCLFPMLTVLSCDSSRIFFYWTVSSILIYLVIPEAGIRQAYPAWYMKIMHSLSRIIYHPRSKAISLILFFFICISPVGTQTPYAWYHSVVGRFYVTAKAHILDLTGIALP